VATVTGVEKNAAYVFAKVLARPAAGVENYRYVMVLPLPPRSRAPGHEGDETPQARQGPGRGRRSQ
jgi:cell shape-determining protein MreC